MLHSPEVWIAKKGAGAQAHVDGHCESTITIQLAGTKRWRLSPMPAGQPLRPSNVYEDGGPYRLAGGWNATIEVELRPGEALVFPPGTIHESVATSDECASSITHQFASPPPLRYCACWGWTACMATRVACSGTCARSSRQLTCHATWRSTRARCRSTIAHSSRTRATRPRV